MVTRPEVLAIVQARGGSKGIPRKNLRLLGRHPLLAYSIASGIAAKTVTRLMVSTEDAEIAEVARQYGAEVPFLRPPELATDDAADFPLFEHALHWLERHENYRPQFVAQLRPTSPFRPRGMIDEAAKILIDDPQADCVRGVTRPNHNPYKMWRKNDTGYLTPLLKTEFAEPYNMLRQALPPTYWQTGHIDVIRYETIVNKHSLTGHRVRPIIIENRYCVDIDTPRHFDLASWALEHRELDIDRPRLFGQARRKKDWPQPIALLVFDFDGVFTDNRVWVMQDGREIIACHRSDGLGLAQLQAHGLEVVVLSSEENPVVAARCRKLGLPCRHGLSDKAATLQALALEKQIDLQNTVYLGNDVNDLDCMGMAGYAVAVADAHPTVLGEADLILQTKGGEGAIREFCDLILQNLGENEIGTNG